MEIAGWPLFDAIKCVPDDDEISLMEDPVDVADTEMLYWSNDIAG
jgi:hypothetical protein